MVDHAGRIKLIHAAGVDKIAWLEEGNLPPKLKSMFPELSRKTITLKQKKGEVDILMGLDNSRWLPHQANNEGKSPGNFRLMKSKFGGRYMIMGLDAEMHKPKKIRQPAYDALERVRRGWVALTLLLMATSSGEAQEICGEGSGGVPGQGSTLPDAVTITDMRAHPILGSPPCGGPWA
jgi:hypothetical protein